MQDELDEMTPFIGHVQTHKLWALTPDGWVVIVVGKEWECAHEASRWPIGLTEVILVKPSTVGR